MFNCSFGCLTTYVWLSVASTSMIGICISGCHFPSSICQSYFMALVYACLSVWLSVFTSIIMANCLMSVSMYACLSGYLLVFFLFFHCVRLFIFLFWNNCEQALTAIASSPLRIDLRVILSEILPVLASFLRKNQRALKLSTLALLDTLVKNYSSILRLVFYKNKQNGLIFSN